MHSVLAMEGTIARLIDDSRSGTCRMSRIAMYGWAIEQDLANAGQAELR